MIGEALIDLVPRESPGDYHAHAGGSPFNVAVALARLRNRTALMARLGDHHFGKLLRDRAAAEGVDLSASARAAEPATLAVVSFDGSGQASYEFYLEGTADWRWSIAELRKRPSETAVLHYGSLASWTPPGSERIDQLIREARARNGVLISYDPNIRPAVLATPVRGRTLVERSVGRSHLVKASREDLEWLYPAWSLKRITAHWTKLGAALVVVTDGAAGATAYRRDATEVARPGRPIELVDTIGAGDAFTAGLLSAFVRRDLHVPNAVAEIADEQLIDVLDEAILVSSLTCERAGADPPRLANATPGSRPLVSGDFAPP